MDHQLSRDETIKIIFGDKLIFVSSEKGLRPLITFVTSFEGKLSGCTLIDKVIGLAAARLIINSGLISEIFTNVMSVDAKQKLLDHHIVIHASKIIPAILNRDRSDLCPAEKKARSLPDDQALLQWLRDVKAM